MKIFNDDRGSLIPCEFKDLPFIPNRIFVVTDVPAGCIRGNHAHKTNEQMFICIKGQIIVGLDDGVKVVETILNPGDSIHIPKMIWDYQKYITGNEIAVVVSSINYLKSDYITNKEEFYMEKNK